MVLKNNKPVFYSSTGVSPVTKPSIQVGQETITIPKAVPPVVPIYAALGAM
jgi:hypothetical protein